MPENGEYFYCNYYEPKDINYWLLNGAWLSLAVKDNKIIS